MLLSPTSTTWTSKALQRKHQAYDISDQELFVANREENRINWKWLKGELPEPNGKVKDRDYSKDELLRMWIQSDVRKRAILGVLMTGMRKGAIPGLCYRNRVKVTAYRDKEKKEHKFAGHFYKLIVYEGHPAEYVTFTTLEGTNALDLYTQAREAAGEKDKAKFTLDPERV